VLEPGVNAELHFQSRRSSGSSATVVSGSRVEAAAEGNAAFRSFLLLGAFLLVKGGAHVRVLIAEDETIIRLDLKGLLEQHGMIVCAEARDGEEAVTLARRERPDVAVLDLRMPRLDGIEAARRIYAERPMPIVMLTAFADRAHVDKAIEAGVFTYLVKPFRESDVVPAIKAAVARHGELLDARRAVGDKPLRPVVIGVRSPSGTEWPIRIDRRDDGTIEVGAV
jgi:CheY-like chemotaxis protein